MDVLQCDILGFDVDNIVKGFEKVIAESFDAILTLKPNSTPRLMAAFITALSGELQGWQEYQDREEDKINM